MLSFLVIERTSTGGGRLVSSVLILGFPKEDFLTYRTIPPPVKDRWIDICDNRKKKSMLSCLAVTAVENVEEILQSLIVSFAAATVSGISDKVNLPFINIISCCISLAMEAC